MNQKIQENQNEERYISIFQFQDSLGAVWQFLSKPLLCFCVPEIMHLEVLFIQHQLLPVDIRKLKIRTCIRKFAFPVNVFRNFKRGHVFHFEMSKD